MKALIALTAALLFGSAHAVTVTDLAGRSVTLDKPPQRVLLGEGRMLTSLTILDPDLPRQRIVGMLGDFEQLDPGHYALYQARYPALDQAARLGKGGASFSVEEAIRLKPDLAIFSLRGHGPDLNDKPTMKRLSDAGITVVFVDFSKDPLKHTVPSITILGALLGKPERAAEFNRFYQDEMAKVTRALARTQNQPKVFLESRVGLGTSCCETLAHGMLADYVDAAKGSNIAKPLVPGISGTVSVEYLLTHQPDVYIATAIGNTETEKKGGSKRIAMGQGISAATAQASFGQALKRPGISSLSAVKAGRAYTISHHFAYSAANVVAVQAIAKWLHPTEMAGVDPQATLKAFYQRFQPVPLTGAYWTGAPQ
ncbi:ABC transporter substrate-binding protein [Chitinibacteraceae bacterium HSL-7]